MARWQVLDISSWAENGLAFPAAGDVFVYGVTVSECSDPSPGEFDSSGCPASTIWRVVYRGTDNDIYEQNLADPQYGQWRWNNLLSASANPSGVRAPKALSDPTAFAAILNDEEVASVVYQGIDHNIYQLLLIGQWSWHNLSTNDGTTPPATPAAGRAFGYGGLGAYRVVYRGFDNHIYELSDHQGLWHCNNLSTNDKTAPPAQAAAGDPFAYVTNDGVPRVIYRGTNEHIYELHPEPFWRCNDLSHISGAPLAAGKPFGYVTNDGMARVIYRDTDGQIIELRLEGHWKSASLSTNDKTAPPAPKAAGDPFGYVASDGVPRVIYRGTDGHIYELHPEPFWRCNDLWYISGTALAAGDPFGNGTLDGIPRVFYRATGNDVYQLFLQ